MALPKGWDETRNEWRRRLRDPADFVRIRPKNLEGVSGVYIVGGPLKRTAPGHGKHEVGSFVPQAIRFDKTSWPSLTAAVGWFEASRFAVAEPNENPPRRLEAFRAGALTAIEELVEMDVELSKLMLEVLNDATRGKAAPAAVRKRAKELQALRSEQVKNVKTAVARHGAAIEEFSAPPLRRSGRRENPARVKAEAVRLYEQFHGHAPTGYRLERVPDLSQLVALGRVMRIDYQLDPKNARGNRNTPYSHLFGPGSTLLTDPTGRSLVIVGNLKVSRADRGRFGYIRTASGG